MRRINSFYPTLGLSWATVVIFFAASFIVAIPVSVLSTVTGNQELATNSWVLLISYVLSFVLTGGFIYLLQRNVVLEAPARASAPIPISLFVLLLIFTPIVSFAIEPLMAWLPIPDSLQHLFDKMFQLNAATFLMTVIAAPLCEEWLCRGVIAKGLLRHSTPGKAIFWSAFIFATIHMNPWQAVPAFILGLFLGYVYWKTRSLWPCVFIHFVNNGFSFLLLYLFPGADANTSSQDILGAYYWWIYLAAIVVAIPVGYALFRILNSRTSKFQDSEISEFNDSEIQ